MQDPSTQSLPPSLDRALGLPGAVMMGLGSIVGTGIFVSIGIVAGIAGPWLWLAILLAALVATCNGLSSAQLAADHPLSGGTYAYGYRYLNPRLGFAAGWMFLCAKSASAATAALGFAGYALSALGYDGKALKIAVGLFAVAVLTVIVAGGIRRSNLANTVIVGITLVTLLAFVLLGLPSALARAPTHLMSPGKLMDTPLDIAALLQGTALMFVAYTGYGRIATLGEEVSEPRRTIPKAMVLTLGLIALIYLAVGFVAMGSVGAQRLGTLTQTTAAPLEWIAAGFAVPQIRWVLAFGAVTAMLGVLLNLLLGLSRVVLAMARQGDLPRVLGRVDEAKRSPVAAVVLVGIIIAALVCLGSVKATWAFSAFTVLVYYALTNLAALRLPPAARLYPRWISWAGLFFCLGLAVWIPPTVWMAGLSLLVVGFVWQQSFSRLGKGRGQENAHG